MQKKFLIPFFLVGTIAMMLVMVKTGASLKTPTTPSGIIDLEFAYNQAMVTTITDAWKKNDGVNNITAAIQNTCWDFLFIFFYSGFLFLACRQIAYYAKKSMTRSGQIIATGALLAGAFDIIENAGILLSLHGHISNTTAFITVLFSVIKWSLVVVTVLYLITGLLLWVFKKITI